MTAGFYSTVLFINWLHSLWLNLFIPENPRQGGPPHSRFTSPLSRILCPLWLVLLPSMACLRSRLQSSLKTVQSGLLSL